MASWLDNKRNDIWRGRERARFDRWFLETDYGTAYVDRAGRARSVKPEEVAEWRAAAWDRIDTMIADAPVKGAIAFAVLVGLFIGLPLIFGALGIDGAARKIGMAVAIVTVEAGLIGFDVHDYFRDWRDLRDRIEARVVSRAPLPIDPQRTRIPRNWFLIGQYVIGGVVLLVYFASHIDERFIDPRMMGWLILLVPVAWAFHFAEQRQDRQAQDRLRR